MIFVIWITLFLGGSLAEDGPLVETTLGQIRGFYKTSFEGRVYSAFEGIPYAKPPVGDLRFEAPQPITPWNNVLHANISCTCQQMKIPDMNFANVKEDCLYLNVYVPKVKPSQNDNYDVIVNIHGGAFMAGSTQYAEPRCYMDRDIVFVNMNYRVGILGFLSTEDTVVPGNNGLKDQQMVLKWVQSHIKSFGGNPNSVTLMGLSAGGAAVHFHYFSPQSRGLFHRGVSQSGNALMPWALQENALGQAKKIAESLNCSSTHTQILIDCLKAVPADDIIEETKNFFHYSRFPMAPFAPVVEVQSNSSFLTKHPYHQLQDGEIYDVAWLTSITKDEGLMGVMYLNTTLEDVENNWNELSEHLFDYVHVCPKINKTGIAEKIKSFYLKNEKISRSNIKSFIQIFTDRIFKVDFEIALEMQTKVASSPIYATLYHYNKNSAFKKLSKYDFDGVGHGADAVLLHNMDSINFPLSESDIRMKNILLDFLVSFAKDGKPKSDKTVWEPFTTANHNYLLINDVNDFGMVKIPKLAPTEFWRNLQFTEHHRVTRV